MALIKCPDCGNEVSEQARTCPICGFPIERHNLRKAAEAKVREDKRAKIKEIVRLEEERRLREEQEQREREEREKKRLIARRYRIALIGIAAALLLDLLLCYIFVLHRPFRQYFPEYSASVANYQNAVFSYNNTVSRLEENNTALADALADTERMSETAGRKVSRNLQEASAALLEEARGALQNVPAAIEADPEVGRKAFTSFSVYKMNRETIRINNLTTRLTTQRVALSVPDHTDRIAALESMEQQLYAAVTAYDRLMDPSGAFAIGKLIAVKDVSAAACATAEADPDKVLDNGCGSAVYFMEDSITERTVRIRGDSPLQRGVDGGGVIEVYPDSDAAEQRLQALNAREGEQKELCAITGTAVIRVSKYLPAERQQELLAAVAGAIGAY